MLIGQNKLSRVWKSLYSPFKVTRIRQKNFSFEGKAKLQIRKREVYTPACLVARYMSG
jgi:hypothetical protein